MRSFLDFYTKHEVAPVHYSFDDNFVSRRIWLYAQLGVPPSYVRENTVLEFGPGTGANSKVIVSLQPSKYVLVEANPTSISSTSANVGHLDFTEIVEREVLLFDSPEQFSLVIAENIIPGQYDSVGFSNHILSFVEPGGVAILTAQTEAGLLADMCRQLLAPEIRKRSKTPAPRGAAEETFKNSVDLGVKIFSEDLAGLEAATRSPADWVIDNVLHDWLDRDRTFSPREALASLPPQFDVLSSSPSFGIDPRWFKTISKDSPKSMSLLVDETEANIPALLDYRVPIGTRMRDPQKALSILASLFELRDQILKAEDYSGLSDFLEQLQCLGDILPEESHLTRSAIQDYGHRDRGISCFVNGRDLPNWPNFSPWWGRATLYLSFWRRP